MAKKMKRVLSGLVAIAFSFALGACETAKLPSYNVAVPDFDTQERAKTDPKLEQFVKKMESDIFIVTATSPAQDVNDVTLKTQFTAPKDFKGPEDFKPLGAAQTDSFNAKMATTIAGGVANVLPAVAGGLALGKSMPGISNNVTAKAATGQSQATSGVAGNVTVNNQ